MLLNALPTSLFNPFTAPGADVYANILAGLFAETQRRPQPLSRNLVLDIILSHLAKSETLARAQDILNYLERCGWLRPEVQTDFTRAYTLPAHAFELLQILSKTATDEPPPVEGLMVAIHDLLQAAARGEGREARLAEAGRLTSQLQAELKKIQHNPAWHQLNFEALAQLRQDILNTTAKHGEAAAPIEGDFQAIDRLLNEIESRQRALAESAKTEAQPASAQLIRILNFLSSDPSGLTDSLINLYHLEVFDSEPLAFPSFPPFPFIPDSVSIPSPSTSAAKAAQRETARQLNRPVSRERVRRLAQSILRDRSEIRAADIVLSGSADPSGLLSVAGQTLPLLIFLRAYGDGSLGYHVEELEEFTWVEAGGVGFRDFLVKGETPNEPEPIRSEL
ncbi:MAG: hypothetical protein HYZ49_08960 [Chloroflexi bacterium]|nr:hypothetical protein [Chloroflexota bacterium]